MLAGGLITLEQKSKWTGPVEFEVLPFCKRLFSHSRIRRWECACYGLFLCELNVLVWNHWWFKTTAMLWNLTPQPPECLHCLSHQASADCRGRRAEALTGTDTRLNLTENALISVSVKVAEPIHSNIQRVATSKSGGTCWTLACLQDSLENRN